MTDDELEAIDQPARWPDVFDARDHAALRLADAVSADSHEIDAELTAELRELFTELELAELLLVCAHANFNNRAGNAAKQLLGSPDATNATDATDGGSGLQRRV